MNNGQAKTQGIYPVSLRDIVGIWRFGELTAPVMSDGIKDSSGNNNHFTTVGSLKTTPQGIIDRAVDFSGASNYLGQEPISIADNITISAWIKRDDFAVRGAIVVKIPVHTNFAFYFENNGTVQLRGGVSAPLVTTPVPSGREWHHFVGVIEGEVGSIYIDGQLKNSKNIAAIGNLMVSGTNDVLVGTLAKTFTYSLDGLMSELMIWNRGLSASEVKVLYNHQLSQ